MSDFLVYLVSYGVGACIVLLAIITSLQIRDEWRREQERARPVTHETRPPARVYPLDAARARRDHDPAA